MNYKATRGAFVQSRQIPYMRIAFAAGAALILLMASLATTGQSMAAGAGAEIRATGTFTTRFSSNICHEDPLKRPEPSCVPTQTVGDLVIFSRYNVSTYTGSLVGTTVSLSTTARDDVVGKKAFASTRGTFSGTLELEPGTLSKPGSFALLSHFVTDRSDLTVPFLPIEGRLVVVEGSGMGGLEGICGGGSFKSVLEGGLSTGVTEFDFTFRFGKDCRANN